MDKELDYEVDENGCWIFAGCKDRSGYGIIKYQNKSYKAHRFAYIQSGKPLRDEQVVMHLCDNPSCIRVDHLRAATQRENLEDMRAKGRGRGQEVVQYCKNNHKLNRVNSYRFNNRTVCRLCKIRNMQ
jgi:hypothetical protein